MKSRIWLLDGLRSLSVVVMIIYHFLYDLEVFYHYEVGLFEGVWPVIRVTFAGLFIFLAGYSSTLSRRVFRQGIFLWVMALGITGAMLWYLPSQRIYFGVLHLLGSGYLLSGVLFLKLSSKINLVMGIVVLFLQKVVDSLPLWLLPIGGGAYHLGMADYFPLIPWLAPFLFGVTVGQMKGLATFVTPESKFTKILFWPGRYSLWIYLVHQPILLGLLSYYLD